MLTKRQAQEVLRRAKELAADPRVIEAARRKYSSLHWGATAPRDFTLWDAPDPLAGPLVELGSLVAVEYLTEKVGDGLSVYRHEFGRRDGSRRPVLAVNTERRLIIAGGHYTVAKRGIVG